jgi:hypothetical protein
MRIGWRVMLLICPPPTPDPTIASLFLPEPYYTLPHVPISMFDGTSGDALVEREHKPGLYYRTTLTVT